MKRLFLFLLCCVLMFSLVACKEEDPNSTVTPENQIKQEEVITYKTYEKANFFYLSSLQIPSEWYLEETKNGFVVMEPKSGSEITFIIEDYNPIINNVNYDSAKNSLTTDTKKFIAFQKTAGNEILSKYEWLVNGKKYIVTEQSKFNFKYIYTLKLLCEEKYLEKYAPVLTNIYNSMLLSNDIKTIPHGFNGAFHTPTNVLTIYPRDWKTTSGGDYYTSSIANTVLTVTYAKSINNFAGMDKTTYTQVMQQTVKNYSTASFVNQNGQVSAEGYYTENSVRYIVYNTILNAKDFSLNIVFVSPEKELSAYRDVYLQTIQNIFLQQKSTDTVPEQSKPPENTPSTEESTPPSESEQKENQPTSPTNPTETTLPTEAKSQ